MSYFRARLLLIIFILHQTLRTFNATHIESHFGLLNFVSNKMTEARINNDFNLTGKC